MAGKSHRSRVFALLVRWSFVATLLLIVISARSNLGLGIDKAKAPTGWGADVALLEASLVRGGVVLVTGRTRVNNVSSYEQTTGASYFFPFSQRVYIFDVDPVRGRWVWLPWIERPGGTYVFLPLWPLVIALGLLVVRDLLAQRAKMPDVCDTCGYAQVGLAPGTPCPECGQASQ